MKYFLSCAFPFDDYVWYSANIYFIKLKIENSVGSNGGNNAQTVIIIHKDSDSDGSWLVSTLQLF